MNVLLVIFAIHLRKAFVERDIEKKIPDVNAQIVVYCSGRFHCALLQSLQKRGYTQVLSLNIGLQGWLNAGYKLEQQIVKFDNNFMLNKLLLLQNDN